MILLIGYKLTNRYDINIILISILVQNASKNKVLLLVRREFYQYFFSWFFFPTKSCEVKLVKFERKS